MMRERDYLQLRAATSKLESDSLIYKKIQNQVNNKLRSEKKQWQKARLQECDRDTSMLWKNVKSWLNWKPSSGAPCRIYHDDRLEKKPSRIAECMNKYFVDKSENDN